MKNYLIMALCLILSLGGVACTSTVESYVSDPVAVADDDDSQKRAERMADLDYLCSNLAVSHPDMYRNTTSEAIERKRQEIISKMEGLDDFSFAIELQTLVAMLGDSHTTISVNQMVDENMRMLPIRLKAFGNRWVLSTVPTESAHILGYELLALNGHPMPEVHAALAPFFSSDNEVKLDRQFVSSFYVVPILQHFGIMDDESSIPLVVSSSEGETTTVIIPVIAAKDTQSYGFSSLSRLRMAVPETEWDRTRNYKALPIGDALYIQYNVCRQDKDLPMDEFVLQLRRMMEAGNYEKIIIDLRNNGGGSDGVLRPVLEWLPECMAAGKEVYTLIGETTFSSAVINGVMLQMIGSTLVGTPSSGNVDHFGATDAFVLPNLPLQVRYSTKYMDLGEYFGAEDRYGDSPLMPDVVVGQTLSDYLAGIDTAVEYVLDL